MKEKRIVNEETGGAKGQKQARFDLVPVAPLWEVASLYGKGAEKYDARNWQRGYNWSLSYGALLRHISLWWNGQDTDEEMGVHHLACAVFHCFALMEFAQTHPEMDDRPQQLNLFGVDKD